MCMYLCVHRSMRIQCLKWHEDTNGFTGAGDTSGCGPPNEVLGTDLSLSAKTLCTLKP